MEDDFVEKIHIAQFWRNQLGEVEYVYQNPDDLRRWYIALETRGPDEVRAYLKERTGRHPISVLTGIVATPPHPPIKIIELWLDAHRKTHVTRPVLGGCAAFLLVSVFVATNLQSCQHVKNPIALQTNPGQTTGPIMTGQAGTPPPTATQPINIIPPANQASSPTGTPPK